MYKTPISMLQELMVAKNEAIPMYSFESIGNLLEPKFACTVQTSSFAVTAESRAKKDAKQLAAKLALMKLGYKVSDDVQNSSNIDNKILPTVSPKHSIPNKNYIGELNEFASGSGSSYPLYEFPIFPANGQFMYTCKFLGLETTGYGATKKEAKQMSSYEMLLLVKSGKMKIAASPGPQQECVRAHHTQSLIDFSEKDRDVLKRLEALSLTGNIGVSASPHTEAYPSIEKGALPIEAAKNELHKINVRYEIKELQNNPYVVVLNLPDKKMTLLGGGKTRIEATTKALNSTLAILREGCSLIE